MVRRGRLTLEDAVEAWNVYRTIAIQETQVDVSAALGMASRHEIYAYDAYYLEDAKSHRIALLSLDQKMRDVALAEGILVLDFEQ